MILTNKAIKNKFILITMKNDPLGALRPKNDSKLVVEKQPSNKSKEFEAK